MPVVINTKTRTELKAFFTTGSRPTAVQFGHLIDAMVNAKDDSVAKSNASPLRLQAEQTGLANPIQKVVEFYNNFTDASSLADFSLKSPQVPTATGLSINVRNTSVLFFDATNANLGIKTSTPAFGLDVNTTVRLGGFVANEDAQWPNVVWLRTADWDEGLIKIPANLTINGKSGFGMHFHESRSFNFYTTNWTRILSLSKHRIAVKAGIHFEDQPTEWAPNYAQFGRLTDALGNAAIINEPREYDSLMILGRRTTAGRRAISMWDDVRINGNLIVRGTVTPSDRRLKENIEPLLYGLAQIKKLSPVSYDWRNIANPKRTIGLLAQDVETVIHEAIYVNNKNANETELCLSYDSLIPVLINAVKELDQKLEEAQLKIAQLQA